jgi:hypothetical protein
VKVPAGADALFRQLTPLVLLGVLLVLVFEPWLPGGAWLRERLGDDALLRACVAVLACYVLILWGEALRLHGMLTNVLGAFRRFAGEERTPPPAGPAGRQPQARLEAARLLIAALGSPDASIRATSRHNLARLAGEDHGEDPAAWTAWLQRQEGTGTAP